MIRLVNVWKIGAWPGWPGNEWSYKNKKKFIRIALRDKFVAIGWSDCIAGIKNEKQIRDECRKCESCRSDKIEEFVNFTRKINCGDIILLYNSGKVFTGVAQKRSDGKIHYETKNKPTHRINVEWLYKKKQKNAKFSWFDTVHKIEVEDLSKIEDRELKHFLERQLNSSERQPTQPRTTTKKAIIRKYGSGGEGKQHKELKDWVAKNPDFLGLGNVIETEKEEHVFLSGDLPDIVFICDANEYAIVEIETIYPLPGAYQAIKYRSLLCAELGMPLDSPNVKSFLVAKENSQKVDAFCSKYKIELKIKK